MSYYTFRLSANKSQFVPVAGTVILIDDLGAAPGLDIQPTYGGRDLPIMPNRKKAFKFEEPFDAVTLTAPVDCTVALFLSKNDVSLGFADGSLVNVSGQVTISNGDAARVPVDIAGGVVNVTATNVGISNDNTKPVPVQNQSLANIVTLPAVAVNTGAAAQVVGDATLKRLRFRNASATASVALGGAGVTMANAAILLAPGDTWLEDDAPGIAWYATSDTNGADLRIVGLK